MNKMDLIQKIQFPRKAQLGNTLVFQVGMILLFLTSLPLRAEEVSSDQSSLSSHRGTTQSSQEVAGAPALKPFPSNPDFEKIANAIVNKNFTKVPSLAGESRYDLNRRLNRQTLISNKNPQGTECTYEGQDSIIIAMEGTGAFEPRLAPLMQELNQELQTRGFDTNEPRYHPAGDTSSALQRKTGVEPAWSGLCRGILSQTLRAPRSTDKMRSFHFPSEEVELLANRDSYKNFSPQDFVQNIYDSTQSQPKGVLQAEACVLDILYQAAKQKKSPKLIITGHSSGARAAIKLLERLKNKHNPVTKKPGIQVDLLFTVDPVKEAHEAIAEASKEIINKGTEHNVNRVKDFFGGTPKKVYPPVVRSTSQPAKLYKPSNVTSSVNFYQTRDTEGLKIEPKFGIQGSPIQGADSNTELFEGDGMGSEGHGQITYAPKVLESFKFNLDNVLAPKP